MSASGGDRYRDFEYSGGGYQEVLASMGAVTASMFASGAQRNPEEEARFRADVLRLKGRLAGQTRGLLQPRGRFVQYWDVVTACALLFTMTVTPFEVGIGVPVRADGLLVVNQAVSAVFAVDIGVQFCLPTPLGEGEYERRHWKLAWNYATSWLALDLVTVVPFDVLVLLGVLGGPVKAIKVMRVLRLLKLAKVLRASAIIQRWENSFNLQSSTKNIAAWSALALIVLHWFACAWAMLPQLVAPQREGREEALEAALLELIDASPDCTGCIAADPSTAPLCASPCLTPCERRALAAARSQRLASLADERQGRGQRILDNFAQLAELDPSHQFLYKDLRSAHALELAGSAAQFRWSSAAALAPRPGGGVTCAVDAPVEQLGGAVAATQPLSGVALTRLGRLEGLLPLRVLDLSHNALRELLSDGGGDFACLVSAPHTSRAALDGPQRPKGVGKGVGRGVGERRWKRCWAGRGDPVRGGRCTAGDARGAQPGAQRAGEPARDELASGAAPILRRAQSDRAHRPCARPPPSLPHPSATHALAAG
jgi:hypothetical protein